jgi:hypothetical protein
MASQPRRSDAGYVESAENDLLLHPILVPAFFAALTAPLMAAVITAKSKPAPARQRVRSIRFDQSGSINPARSIGSD